MSKRDYYEELGLSKGASDDEIRTAYRKLAMQYHPDRNPDDAKAAERFKGISEAYAVLSDTDKRQRYDVGGFGAGDFGAGGFGAGGGNFSEVFGDFFSQFDTMFGGRQTRRGLSPERGADLEYVLEISLEDALAGTKKEVVFNADKACDACEGRGHEEDGGAVRCSGCGGEGMVRGGGGLAFVAQTCGRCRGTGQTFSKPCNRCRGNGVKSARRKLQVDIPSGIDHGQSLRLSNQGAAGARGGPSGDLYVRISVQEHPLFERDGSDLLTEIPLSFTQAALGESIEIKTPDGVLRIKVPAGIQSGQTLRVAGQGAPILRQDRRGDLLCRVQVQTPTKLTEPQKDLLRQFAEKSDSKSGTSWINRISRFFEAVGRDDRAEN